MEELENMTFTKTELQLVSESLNFYKETLLGKTNEELSDIAKQQVEGILSLINRVENLYKK